MRLTSLPLKILVCLSFFLDIAGCKQQPEGNRRAAVKVAGAFITNYVHSSLNFRLKGVTIVKKESDSTFDITGSAEGFSSYNVPFSIKHFSETIRYSGGDINDVKNWECLKMYIGITRIK